MKKIMRHGWFFVFLLSVLFSAGLLHKSATDRGAAFYAALAAENSGTAADIIRGGVFVVVCCILLILSSVVLAVLDAIRTVLHRQRMGLLFFLLLSADIIGYNFLATNIISLLFDEPQMMLCLSEVLYSYMAFFLVLFYWKRFHHHFPKRLSALIWINVMQCFLSVSLDYFGLLPMWKMETGIIAEQAVTVGVVIFMLVEWNRADKSRHTVWMDIAGLGCLLAAVLLPMMQEEKEYYRQGALSNVRALLFVLFSFFVMLQHIHILLSEYREGVEKNARLLADQNARLERANIEAEEAKKEAFAANEAKGKFLANMSHEIRTPINAVLGMDEMILRESREKDIRSYAMDIYTAGQTLLSLINDILDFSKIESGKMEIVPAAYDTSSMIHDLVNMISVRAKAKDLDFVVSVDESLPAKLWGDDVRIRQVLTNILTNAVKYTPEGSIWFRMKGNRNGDRQTLHFEVEDTGTGIKEEDMPKLFGEFERIDEGKNRSIEGTGLGMSITMKFLSMMGSRLHVESTYGKGSLFWFDLDQGIVDDTPVGDIEERIRSMAENYSYQESFTAPEAKILIVDDNRTNRKVFTSLLKATRIQITEAESGMEAIERVRERKFDIIFMDHMMPEMDGVEAMRRIRALHEFSDTETKIFVLTANAVSGAKEEYLEAGFDGFLSKPIVSDKLEKVISENLPDGLIMPSEHEGQILPEDEPVPEDLPAVDGIDWNIAWMHLMEQDLIETTVKDFYDMIPVHAEIIQKLYEMLPDEGAFRDYRIRVHGMKGIAATIGIIPLAGMANVLEYAARDKEGGTVRNLHETFLKLWLSYREKLHGVFGIGEDALTEKEEYNPRHSKAYLEMLVHAMDDMDVDTADAVMEKLEQYHYPDTAEEMLQRLHAAVTGLDSEAVEETVNKLMEIL